MTLRASQQPARSALLALLLAAGSLAAPAGAATWKLTATPPDPAAAALAERFFRGPVDLVPFAAEVDAALVSNPASGTLHEVRGYLALLQADQDALFRHLLAAALDTSNPFARRELTDAFSRTQTVEASRDSLEALELLEQGHPDPDVRGLATLLRSQVLRLLGRSGESERALGRLGFLSHWKLLGAFDNEEGRAFHAVLPPEKGLDLAAAVPGAVRQIRWRSVDRLSADGAVPLGDLVFPTQAAAAYLLTWIRVEHEADAQLRLGSSAPVVAWVNDAEVAREERLRGRAQDNLVVPVHLVAGWNKLLLKSAVKRGSWELSARFTAPSGAPLSLSGESAEPQNTPVATAPPVSATTTEATPSARVQVLQLRELALRGLVHEAAEKMVAALTRLPESPLLRLFASEVLREDAQLERALDLLSGGLADAARPQPLLLVRRASIYAEKKLPDRAEADLRAALAQSPGSRTALVQLANLLGSRRWQEQRRRLLAEAVGRWPGSVFTQVDLAECDDALGYRRAAEERLERLHDSAPGSELVLRQLRSLADRRGDLKAALRWAEQLAGLSPFDTNGALVRADLLRRQGDAAASEALLAALSEQSPDLPGPFGHRARLAEEAGQYERAAALWEQAAERDPKDSGVAERLDHLRPGEADLAIKYLPGEGEIEAAIQHRDFARLPGSHQALLLGAEVLQLNADGSTKQYVVRVSTALTQTGRDQLIHASLPGRNRVLAAYAVQPDGQRQEASSITDNGVRFRKLDVGSTVVLRYVAYGAQDRELPGEFFRRLELTNSSGQVEKSSITLLSQRGRPVSVETTSGVTRSDAVDGAWDVRRFEVTHAPAEVTEAWMSPHIANVQWVAMSTLPDWAKFIAWEKAILLDSFRPDPQIQALAHQLTEGLTERQAQVDRLFRFVAQEIRYQQQYENVLAGWQPHAAAVVLERKYGDCKDKATLFISLARELGITGHFAVLGTHSTGRLPKSVVLPYFNHAIVYLPEQPGLKAQFVDNTVDALDIGNLRYDDQGAMSLVLDPVNGSFSWIEIPFQQPERELDENRISLSIRSAGEARATHAISLRGAVASMTRMFLRNEIEAKELFAHYATGWFARATLISGTQVGNPDALDRPVQLQIESDLSGSITAEGERLRIRLPSAFHLANQVAQPERKTTLDLGPPGLTTVALEATLAPGLRLLAPPPEVAVKSRCIEVTRAVAVEERVLRVTDRYQRTCTEVAPADYAAFRADVQSAAGQLDTDILFGREEPHQKAPAKPERRRGGAVARASE